MRRAAVVLSFVALVAASCRPLSRAGADDPIPPGGDERRTSRDDAGSGAAPSRSLERAADPRQGVVLVTDREALAVLEDNGADFGSVIDGEGARRARNDDLARRLPWRAIAGPLSDDVREVQRADAQAGVAVARFPHRLFDVTWLSSSTARFELVAIVNRIDRRAFHVKACGETRLVYRLGYRRDDPRAPSTASRLPMTVNVELRGEDRDENGECRHAAARWFAPPGATGAALGRWLVSPEGPLSGPALAHDRLVQVVVNMQNVRWPSAVRPDLGGHAEYVLRAFGWSGAEGRYLPRTLESTPDVEKLRRSPALRGELLAWLRAPAHLRGLDEATAVLPEKFLATRVVSVTPRGFSRLSNRPFHQLFEPRSFADLPLDGLRFARSPEALLRRLDEATCSGCHQRRAVAGFHLLGEDPPETVAGNALAVAFSPHVASELTRRRSYLAAALAGGALDDARPFAERAGASEDGYGAPCGLGDPGFASWTCAAGLRATPTSLPRARTRSACVSRRSRPSAIPASLHGSGPTGIRIVTAQREERRARARRWEASARRPASDFQGECAPRAARLSRPAQPAGPSPSSPTSTPASPRSARFTSALPPRYGRLACARARRAHPVATTTSARAPRRAAPASRRTSCSSSASTAIRREEEERVR